MRVCKNSKVGDIAGVIAGILREDEVATLESIGVSTNYLCVKGLALAREFVDKDGMDICISISTAERTIEGNEVKAYVWKIKGIKRPESGTEKS